MLVANTVFMQIIRNGKQTDLVVLFGLSEWYLFETILDPGQRYENRPNWDDWNMITHSILTDL